MFRLLAEIPTIDIIYFFYGGAFLFLSASIAMKDMQGSDLELSRSLWLLGVFGFLHGLHEWLRLFPLVAGEYMTVEEIYQVNTIAIFFFIGSYLFLLWFGILLTQAAHQGRRKWFSWLPAILIPAWVIFVARHGFTMDFQFLRQTAIGARYTIGFTGSVLTGYGMILYSRELKHLSGSVSKKLRYAGVVFFFYAVFAGVMSSSFHLFPLPVPVEIFRGLCAVLITYFIIKALNIFDIEKREQIEQRTRSIAQAEKLTSLGQLAAGMAHEINNPLTNASLAAQLLGTRMKKIGCADGEAFEKLGAVEKNIDRASVIARELLQFSRKGEALFALVDINAVLRGALTLLQYKLKTVVVRKELNEVPEVMGDIGKLEQVFINIISNSIEAMPSGGTITITTSLAKAGVRVRIEDTGGGIPDNNLSRVFDPFFTTKETGKGTGLGLAICYGIVKDHRGVIDVSSAVNKGTTVTVTFPIAERGQLEKDSDR